VRQSTKRSLGRPFQQLSSQQQAGRPFEIAKNVLARVDKQNGGRLGSYLACSRATACL
jgi:hypothetical protein